MASVLNASTLGRVVLWAVLLLPPSGSASAQYMFIDANGDGRAQADDTLSVVAPTDVTIWLDAGHDRSGRPSKCHGATLTTIDSFVLSLRATGGQVVWGQFRPPTSDPDRRFIADSAGAEFHVEVGGVFELTNDRIALGRVSVSVQSGLPYIQIVPESPHVPGAITSFGSRCGRADETSSVRLGSDWFDVNGVGVASARPRRAELGELVAGPGTIVLAGNAIERPYRLAKVDGQLVVNGLTLPPAPRLLPSLSLEMQADVDFIKSAQALRDSLKAARVGSLESAERIREYCVKSSLVSSISVSPNSVLLTMKSGLRFDLVPLRGMESKDPPARVSPREVAWLESLRNYKAFIEAGCVILVVQNGQEQIIGSASAGEILGAIASAKRREPVHYSDSGPTGKRIRDQLERPARLIRVE